METKKLNAAVAAPENQKRRTSSSPSGGKKPICSKAGTQGSKCLVKSSENQKKPGKKSEVDPYFL